jgi:hypothetical protein
MGSGACRGFELGAKSVPDQLLDVVNDHEFEGAVVGSS